MRQNKLFNIFFLVFLISPLCGGNLRAEDVLYDSGKRRDPFIPLSADETSSLDAGPTGIKLEGIIYDPPARSLAILNGKPYLVGESLGDVAILRIFKDYVDVSAAGEERTLRIREEEKNQPL